MYDSKKILFLGVGGAGMAPLAIWLKHHAESISGYDDFLRKHIADYLKVANIEIINVLLKDSFKDFDLVIYSSAFTEENYLLKEARRLDIKCLKRGELLAEIASEKKLIAVVGSHGKTTTSSLIAYGIKSLNLPINYILGGFYKDSSAPAYACDSDWLLAEIDESDGTIDRFSPEITLLLNLDWDHVDRYKDFSAFKAVFSRLLERTKGEVILEESLSRKFNEFNSFKAKKHLLLNLKDGEGDASLESSVEDFLNPRLMTSVFNQSNERFALSLLNLFQEEQKVSSELFNDFPGIDRRQNALFESKSLTVYEDYAHHPYEIKLLINAFISKYGKRELVVVFQPHRFSRTKALIKEFSEVLKTANSVFLLPVYSAYEVYCEGGSSEDLIKLFKGAKINSLSMDIDGMNQLKKHTNSLENPVLLFVGAGSITEFAQAFCAYYENGSTQSAWLSFIQSRVSNDCQLKLSENMASKTTFKIGGDALYYSEPGSTADVLALLESARLFSLDYFCLGRGSNVLIADIGYNGLLMRFNKKIWREIKVIDAQHIWVGCGARLKELCGFVAQLGFSGFEFLEGIPGTLGGALRMNAGAMGRWTFDIVDRVIMINDSGQIKDIPSEAFTVEYRKVKEISQGIALGAVLKVGENQSSNAIRNRMDSYSDVRKGSQPIAPSAGCIFKNPEGEFAGRLIDQYGLKGKKVGGAEVSYVHGNFIINSGGSSAKDVQALIQIIRDTVKQASGHCLEPEVLLLGQDWDSVLEPSKENKPEEETSLDEGP